ncbi:MAG: FAD-dependent oxidoreductase [Lachnospiraceae bacterium]|nr:FAD-dependent oxidoreductase [Lachnospiraceae bacterium]
MKQMYDVVVIGGGPAGLTAALYLARARYRVVVVEKEQFGGQITITSEVVNYPGVARTDGKTLTETMRKQAESFGAEFMLAEVSKLELSGDVKTVYTSRGELQCFGVLLATGAHPRKTGFEGEEEFRGRGVAYCATCDGEFFTGKDVFVVGGGFAAAEESVFLTKYANHVTILIRGDDFKCAKSTAEAARNHEKITVLTNTEIIKATGDTALRTLQYRNSRTGEVTAYQAPEGDSFGIFVFAGYEPETSLVKGIAALNEQGYVETDRRQKTNIDGLYAAGDVCVKQLRQVVTATGDGAVAATELERYAAAMQKKTGIHPVQAGQEISGAQPAGQEASGRQQSNGTAGSSIGQTEKTAPGNRAASALFDEAMTTQLQTVFDRMEQPLILKLFLDDRPVSAELRSYMDEMAGLTDKLTVELSDEPEQNCPCVRIFRQDGTDTGLAFHGVPGGHEFTSFVLGLYNAAGPGQSLDEDTRAQIGQIDRPVELQVLVSLSCTMCPELVTAAQRIATLQPLVRAEVFDLNHFPEIKEKYSVMSVPCLVIDGEKVTFGKKNIQQLLEQLS